LFGYATGSPQKPDKIYFDEMVRADQCAISEFAWLVSAEYARPLRYPPPPPTVTDTSDGFVPVDETDETGWEVIPEGDNPPPRGVVKYDGVNVEVQLDALNWRQFYNSVIQPLVARGANVNITVNLSATHDEGFDLDFIELSIKESVVQISRTAKVEIKRQDNA